MNIIIKEKINQLLKKFSKNLPKFPDGRIDYTNSDKAVVLTCFVKFKDKILLLKRSKEVGTYPETWHTVAGYLDELKPIRVKVLEELQEEIGISKNDIAKIKIDDYFEFFDEKAGKTWIVHPILAELKNEPKIKLDWEHTEYKWIFPHEIKNFNTAPRLEESLKKVLKML
jgi:isopentenyldiphosphate isomerase